MDVATVSGRNLEISKKNLKLESSMTPQSSFDFQFIDNGWVAFEPWKSAIEYKLRRVNINIPAPS